MEISLKISDDLAARAKARGLSVEEYVQELLVQGAIPTPADANKSPRTEKEVQVWLSELAQFSAKIPPLPEIISRDWIYQEQE